MGKLDYPLVVENYHRFATGYLSYRGELPDDCICRPNERLTLIRRAIESEKGSHDSIPPLLQRSSGFFDEEFLWIQQHGFVDEQSYTNADRIGRAAVRVTRADRPILFRVYNKYLILREEAGKQYDWGDIASAVLAEFVSDIGERRYRHVVIDEGQDFSPEMLRSLSAAIPDGGSLTFFGDMVQQIYGQRMSWRSAGFNSPQICHFKENYRNTKQISQLALALADMPGFPDSPDLVEPSAPIADGPLPALIKAPRESEELKFVISNATELAKTGTVAVLFRTRELEEYFRDLIDADSTRLHRDLKRWTKDPKLYCGTYHAAKGLEFDAVFLPLLSDSHWPHPPDLDLLGENEAIERNSRLLYVGITRAKSTLVLTYTGKFTRLLPKIRSLYKRDSLDE